MRITALAGGIGGARFLRGLQAAAPGVQVVESDVGVRTHKRMGWMLRDDSTATGEVVTELGRAAP